MKVKQDFPSILPPGIHDVKKNDLEIKFVLPFDNQTQRKQILGRFLVFLDKLSAIGVSLEIWIDGSFTTEKEEPDDIDVIIFGGVQDINSLPIDKQRELQLLLDNNESKIRYLCDVYFAPKDSVEWRSYWRGWFGFTSDEKPKGIVRLTR